MAVIFSYLKRYRLFMVIAIALTLVELTVELLQPLFMAKIINDGILQEDLSVVIYWGSIMIGLSLVAFAAGIINSFYAAHSSQGFGHDIRNGLFEKIQSFSFTNLSHFQTSSLITRMTNDVNVLQLTLFTGLRIMLRAPLLVIGGLIMALVVNVRLALLLAVAVPLSLLFLIWIFKKGRPLFNIVQQKLDGVNRVMRENLLGIKLIRALLRKDTEVDRFTKSNQELMGSTVSALRLMEITMPIILLLMNVSILGVLWFGSFQVNAGGANVGEVVAVINYATRISGAFSVFSMIIIFFSRARASSERIVEVLNTEVDLVDKENSKEPNKRIEKLEGNITFRKVSFRYPATDRDILKAVSFEAERGSTVAVLGSTGSGKSSMFHLIPRLYDVTDGEIEIDDKDIRTIKLDHLRKQIGYVPQETLLFTGTIKDNIAWGKEDATDAEIIEAAKKAQIHETISKFTNGYNTVLGQKGVNLSGGQKQRLAIARALVRKPKILLLDDSTSALDLKTEAKILASLRELQCTTLIITQKISTAVEADKILILDDGEMIAEGTHQDLITNDSLYQKIYRSQFGEEAMYVAKGSE
ncbi:ABC transporter ATP-binding protein [Alkalihalobacterium chitinilyticum]|uniref:ABC transporter ATP-binding protein/permease n=1 Tax=Alkalihalobacterium chitinilyticum TaxID=2980103 RepID=A0ABT5VJR1_9BACI|nr:ABC transporter ATP-binding protein [Alkalihalobacterium chitinilyticum]MDE5415547.1 ABC transporter ATP-binding protein/permease [Alkalihalobacterium chitinilyticum]